MAIWKCPRCPQSESLSEMRCDVCRTEFPSIQVAAGVELKLMSPQPEQFLVFWRQNFGAFLNRLDQEITELGYGIAKTNLQSSTKARLTQLREAKIESKKLLKNFMAFIGPPSQDFILQDLGENQGLEIDRYFAQAFRDWAWPSDENKKMLECLKEVFNRLEPLQEKTRTHGKSLLVLGSGACRLGFDLSCELENITDVYFLDIHPFLLKVGASMILGDRPLSLIDFPLYPLSSGDVSRKYLFEPLGIQSRKSKVNYHFVWADAQSLPFKEESLDFVLTPWFLDIYPRGMSALMSLVAHGLKRDGVWLNTGSLATAQSDWLNQWTFEEVLENLSCDFCDIQFRHDDIAYLENALTYQKRVEKIFSFAARRKDRLQTERPSEGVNSRSLFEAESKQAVPVTPRAQAAKVKYEIVSFVLAQVDNQKSLLEIAKKVSEKYGLEEKESLLTVSRFLKRLV
jgi:hypothetical protein